LYFFIYNEEKAGRPFLKTMELTMKLRNFRVSPRKARRVADLIRGKGVAEARAILSYTVNKCSQPFLKLLNSAVDAAKRNFKSEESDLFISSIRVDEGLKLKRWFPMSRGRAYPILKRSSHIILTLSDQKKSLDQKLRGKTDKKIKKDKKK